MVSECSEPFFYFPCIFLKMRGKKQQYLQNTKVSYKSHFFFITRLFASPLCPLYLFLFSRFGQLLAVSSGSNGLKLAYCFILLSKLSNKFGLISALFCYSKRKCFLGFEHSYSPTDSPNETIGMTFCILIAFV